MTIVRHVLASALLGLAVLTAHGQDQSTAATTAPASTTSSNTTATTPAPSGKANTAIGNNTAKTTSQAATQLQTVVVEGVPINANALPTRPTDAVYGLGDTVQNTPRSVYQVSQDQLINDPVQSVSDLARYSPSISNITSQGIAGAPYIRGYTAEVYEDGIRVEHPNMPFDTNAYQSVDIVTGPASVVYGPSANTSGYLDWEAKQPEFDGNHTTINTTFGNWDSGGTGSYANFSQQIDNTGPINKDLAYRISYKQNEADSYYTGGRNNYEDVYAALTWKANQDIEVDWNFEFGDYDYNNVRGYNRITQNLINNGVYTSGVATPVLSVTISGHKYYYEPAANSPTAPNTGYIMVTPNGNFSQYIPNGATVPAGIGTTAHPGSVQGFVLRAANATYSKIYPYNDLADASDPVNLHQYKTNLTETYDVDDDFKIVNKSYYEHDDVAQQTLVDASLQGDHNDTFEDRTEFQLDEHYNFLGLDIEHKSNSGVDQRYVDDVTLFGNSNYLLDPFDISSGGPYSLGGIYGVPDSEVNSGAASSGLLTSASYGAIKISPTYPVDGFQSPLVSEEGGFTDETRLAQIGLFTLHEFDFGNQWTWYFGARGTGVFANVSNPVEGPTNTVGDNTFDILPNITSSLLYKPVPWTTLYLTYNYLQALNQDSGGGIAYGSGGTLGEAAFHSPSSLYEAGAKFTIIPNQLYANVAGYYQERYLGPSLTSAGFVYPQVKTSGFETSVNYQPNKNVSSGINYSWLQAYYHHYNPDSSFSSPFGIVADGETVFSSTAGSGTASSYPAGNYRLSLPENRINAFSEYSFPNGLGVRGDLWVTSSWEVVNDVATIPWEYNVDIGVFYAQPRYRVEVDFQNVTNQTNWSLINGDTAENIQPSEPFAIQGKFSLYF